MKGCEEMFVMYEKDKMKVPVMVWLKDETDLVVPVKRLRTVGVVKG